MRTFLTYIGVPWWAAAGIAAGFEPAVRWAMDDPASIPGKLHGFHDFMPGVSGKCLVCDGFTTKVVGEPSLLEPVDVAKGFSLRAWVSLVFLTSMVW